MTRERPSDLAASVRQRLLNLAKARGEELQLVLTRHGVERLLYRLGRSADADRFVLKGAMLFYVWDGVPHRPTRDVDFAAFGDPSMDALASVFRGLCEIAVEADGLVFQQDTVEVEPIRDRQEYGGVRVTLSEKFQAMVVLGIANTRMKDFYDVWLLSETREFDGARLAEAIAATFSRRGTRLPSERPLALSDAFSRDTEKQVQWRAFLTRGRLTGAPPALDEVTDRITEFVLRAAQAAGSGERFDARWLPARG